jgi:hypothetical protein
MRRARFIPILLAFGAAAAVGRRRSRRRDHVELFFKDGSVVSLDSRAAETAKLRTLARAALALTS